MALSRNYREIKLLSPPLRYFAICGYMGSLWLEMGTSLITTLAISFAIILFIFSAINGQRYMTSHVTITIPGPPSCIKLQSCYPPLNKAVLLT